MEVGANFDVRGLLPDLVTQTLGMNPDRTWRKGDLVEPQTQFLRTEKYDCWRLTEKTSDAYLGVGWLLEKLIDRMAASLDSFAKLPCDSEIVFDVWMYLYPQESNPSCIINTKVVQFLGTTNARLEMDIISAARNGDV